MNKRFNTPLYALAALVAALALVVAGCGGSDSGSGENSDLSGSIAIDGSSTVYPFAQAAAEGFQSDAPDVKVTVGESGTGGGFEKFCAGETQISTASRPIEEDEIKNCEKNGVSYKEIQVAQDGIAVVTNPELKIQCLTTDELKEIWNKGSNVKTLAEVQDGAPSTELSLFGPGTDSGTFDYFTEAINGEEGVSRNDYQPSEDDNVLVEGVSGDAGGLGYFGFSYYEQNKDKLNLVEIDGGDGCVAPSTETIQNGTYKPLSRPLFFYVAEDTLASPEGKAFVDYTLNNNAEIAQTALIVPLGEEQLTEAKTEAGTS